jgi:dipeptidyl aminopeptidase/acylaminoacyl peptidase
VSILEDHTIDEPAKVVTTLVSVNTTQSTVTPFASGADFYSSATFNPSGTRIAWIQWYHPDMPWYGAELIVADIEFANGAVSQKNAVKIAGEPLRVSVAQPRWVDDNVLLFTSDESGYQNPWIVDLSSSGKVAGPLFSANVAEDFGEPAWFLGDACFVIMDADTVIFTAMQGGVSVLYRVSLASRVSTQLNCPFVHVSRLRRISATQLAFMGESTHEPLAIVVCTLDSGTTPSYKVVKSSASGSTSNIAPYFAEPKSVGFQNDQGQEVFMMYYDPFNPDFVAPAGEKPPLIVYIHGGPTSIATQGLSLKQQYFTSRGYAWVDVNYGGSSGYGRKYMCVLSLVAGLSTDVFTCFSDRLNPNWGIVDVTDSVSSIKYLISIGAVDPARVVITGGSSGGYTTLQSMCTTTDVYAAGTSSYGISDLTMLMKDTHKFESHYPEVLLGGTPETVPDVYYDRSPVNNAEKIKSPLLVRLSTQHISSV